MKTQSSMYINLRNVMKTASIALTLTVTLSPAISSAELTVASPFTDHAVLQRDMAVPVWGTADAGNTITVEFAGQKKSSIATDDGTWQIELDAMPGSATPKTLQISDSKSQLTFDDVVIGEVWICSGQSNMQMGGDSIPEIKALVPKAKNIRRFTVKQSVAFEEQDSCSGEWMEQHPASAVAFAFAYFLQDAADVPVGIIQTSWGSSSLEGWTPRDMTERLPHFKEIMTTFDRDEENRKRITNLLNGPKPWSRKDDIFLRRQPNILYNAMMHPLAPYACRGIAWYQGESNSGSLEGMLQYEATLKGWIERYREEWGRDDLHFLIVMLPGFGRTAKGGPEGGPESPVAHSWAWMRESQLKTLELPHTSVANTIDLGHLTNIHPKDKLPVGERLALLAARDTLGHEIEAQGPELNRVLRSGDHLIVHFDHAQGLKTIDGKSPTAFWIADQSARWVKADATLKGQSVVLRSSEVPAPLYVRYAFAGKPKVNLVNGANLPALPFRTDRFEP